TSLDTEILSFSLVSFFFSLFSSFRRVFALNRTLPFKPPFSQSSVPLIKAPFLFYHIPIHINHPPFRIQSSPNPNTHELPTSIPPHSRPTHSFHSLIHTPTPSFTLDYRPPTTNSSLPSLFYLSHTHHHSLHSNCSFTLFPYLNNLLNRPLPQPSFAFIIYYTRVEISLKFIHSFLFFLSLGTHNFILPPQEINVFIPHSSHLFLSHTPTHSLAYPTANDLELKS
ncbi:MAG: hypothetical protein BYD32DRAFT_385978, partial [Podila humilis]